MLYSQAWQSLIPLINVPDIKIKMAGDAGMKEIWLNA
jgi:hypothetical protein